MEAGETATLKNKITLKGQGNQDLVPSVYKFKTKNGLNEDILPDLVTYGNGGGIQRDNREH